MACNGCGADVRCFQISEITNLPGLMARREGMSLEICPDCIGKILAAAGLGKASIPKPEDVPLSERTQKILAKLKERGMRP